VLKKTHSLFHIEASILQELSPKVREGNFVIWGYLLSAFTGKGAKQCI